MKKATQFALIGFSILVLISLYNSIMSIILAVEIDDYKIWYVISNFLRLIAFCGVWYFFFTLYKKQAK